MIIAQQEFESHINCKRFINMDIIHSDNFIKVFIHHSKKIFLIKKIENKILKFSIGIETKIILSVLKANF